MNSFERLATGGRFVVEIAHDGSPIRVRPIVPTRFELEAFQFEHLEGSLGLMKFAALICQAAQSLQEGDKAILFAETDDGSIRLPDPGLRPDRLEIRFGHASFVLDS